MATAHHMEMTTWRTCEERIDSGLADAKMDGHGDVDVAMTR